ncbi:unnamed protein product, partial [Didymodactylos carnosus]
ADFPWKSGGVLCKQEYHDDVIEQRRIDEFHRSDAIQEIVSSIDIYEQLKQLQHQQQELDHHHLQYVYRGQRMSSDELHRVKSNIGELISMNSFLSTSLNREQARGFIVCDSEIDHNYQTVLFEIEITHSPITKPYANITEHSYFDSEEEVLFMIGSIFRIVAIDHDVELNIWIVQLVLCKGNELELKPVYNSMRMEILNNKHALGKLLWQMCEFDLAENYYQEQLLNDNEPLCYHGLGLINRSKGYLDIALDYHHQALSIQLPSDRESLAYTYNYIGEIHMRKRNNQLALKYFQLALDTSTNDHPNIACCYHNLGVVYRQEKQYDLALEHFHRSNEINQKYLPIDHPHQAAT